MLSGALTNEDEEAVEREFAQLISDSAVVPELPTVPVEEPIPMVPVEEHVAGDYLAFFVPLETGKNNYFLKNGLWYRYVDFRI